MTVSPEHTAAALALAGRGFAVFPLRPNAKTPAVRKDWEGAATGDRSRIESLWHVPGMNVGIACGPSRLLVIDLDVDKSAAPDAAADGDGDGEGGESHRTGADALRELAAGREIPRTLTVSTPSGGQHLYFRPPDQPVLRNTAGRLGHLIDTRGVGGYIVGPGSSIDGGSYEIVVDAPIAALPQWIVDELTAHESGPVTAATSAPTLAPAAPIRQDLQKNSRHSTAYAVAALRGEIDSVFAARPGTRNDTLNRAAFALGQLVSAGLLDRSHVAVELGQAGRAIGLPPREVASTVASGLNAGTAKPRQLPDLSDHWSVSRPAGDIRPGRDRPAFWDEVATGHNTLHIAVQNLRRELAAVDIGTSGSVPDLSSASARAVPHVELATTLRDVDAAYDIAALSAAPLAYTSEWHRIRNIADALRDLRDEIEIGAADQAGELHEDVHFLAALHALAARACRTVSLLAFSISSDLPPRYGRRTSPAWGALRHLQQTTDTAAAQLLGGPADGWSEREMATASAGRAARSGE